MKMLIDMCFDWESRSHLDLKVVGAAKYWAHPSTEGTRLTYSFGRTGPVKIWRPLTEPMPVDLLDVAYHPEKYNFIAWNVYFDFLGWICYPPRRADVDHARFRRPELKNIHDAMALSCHFRTGASLESCTKFMELDMGKDPVGRRIMLKQCKPDRTGKYPALTAEEEEHFDRYAILDTVLLRKCYYRLPPLPGPERYAWEWTFRRNLGGLRIDLDLVNELNDIVDAAMPGLQYEFMSYTGTKFNSHVKVKEWFQQFYPEIENMDATTLRDLLIDKREVPWQVRRALELKDLAGSTSVSKLKTALDTQYCGKVFEILAYHVAQTKRWGGRGIQIQNNPRVDGKRPDSIKFDMNVEDLASVVRELRPTLKDPIGFVKNLLRRIFIPSPGNMFYCGDFSKVEPSILFWLLDMGEIPEAWYEEMAAAIYGKRVEDIAPDSLERTIGKIANLSCQYGTGEEGYRKALYKQTGIVLSQDEARKVIFAYREKNSEVVRFWGDLEDGFAKAVRGQSTALCRGRVHIMPMGVVFPGWKGVVIRLPSGSHLFYHGAIQKSEVTYEHVTEKDKKGRPVKIFEDNWLALPPVHRAHWRRKERTVLKYLSDQGSGRVGHEYVYYGTICENVVSATARDVIVPSTWQLENAGFEILGLVHDEIWGDAAAGREEEFKRLMCINPSWCDMKITSDLKCGARYLK